LVLVELKYPNLLIRIISDFNKKMQSGKEQTIFQGEKVRKSIRNQESSDRTAKQPGETER
jgi:hypothetical protein